MLGRVSSVCCLNGDFEDRVCENMQIFGRICGLPGNFNILIGGAVSKICLVWSEMEFNPNKINCFL